MTTPIATATESPSPETPAKRRYVRAVGPRLKKLLYVLFALLALLGANSLYLVGVRVMNAVTGHSNENWLWTRMFLAHIVLGLVFVAPFVVFGVIHMWNTRGRKNRRAVRVGYALFATSVVVLVTGLLLLVIDITRYRMLRATVFWLHLGSPLVAGWLYWLHRLAGPRIKWRIGLGYLAAVGVVLGGILVLQAQDPREWYAVGPESPDYFKPSLVRTTGGKWIAAEVLDMNEYCLKCHADVHARWKDSAHHLSSFNNPTYLASVKETRDVLLARDGDVKASRWCAGCHDPVPFLSGKFDDPNFDIL
ncbi:MAG: hypothetical protein KY476_09945, partial [Planctomycetes bacterium]|nr:hypothetical protein [Planctomycetota bacterium]